MSNIQYSITNNKYSHFEPFQPYKPLPNRFNLSFIPEKGQKPLKILLKQPAE